MEGSRRIPEAAGTGRTPARDHGPAFILLLYAAGAVFLLPRFDFSFNDDWAYLRMARHFLETGRLRFWGYEQAFSLTQAFLAGLAWRLAGRASWLLSGGVTLGLSLAGCLAFRAYLRKLGHSPAASLAGALLLAFNPIYFLNSFGFMTDVPSLALALVAVYLFQSSLDRPGYLLPALAALVSILGFFNRQFNILVPAAFFTADLLNPARRRALDARRVLLTAVLPGAAAVLGTGWWLFGGRMFIPASRPSPGALRLDWVFLFLYAGLFTFPLWTALMAHFPFWKRAGKRVLTIMASLAGLAALALILAGRGFPFLPNQITRYGVFDHKVVLQGLRQPVFPAPFLAMLTVVSVVGFAVIGALAAAGIARGARPSRWSAFVSSPGLPLYLFTAYYAASLLLTQTVFDRYFIYIVPGFTLFLLEAARRFGWSRGAAAASLGLLLAFSIIHTGGTISWNRAVWREAASLVRRGVPPIAIDAGYAWCGWHHIEEVLTGKKDRPPELRGLGRIRSIWYLSKFFPHSSDDYAVSFSPLDRRRWRVIGKAPWRALPFERQRYVYVCQRRR